MRISDWSSDVCSSDLLNASLEDAAIDQGILTYCAANGVVDCGGGNFFGAAQYALLNPGKGITIAPAFALDGSFDPISLTADQLRSEEHTSELQSLMRISYAVF